MTIIATQNGSVLSGYTAALLRTIIIAVSALLVGGTAGVVLYLHHTTGQWKVPTGDDLVRLERKVRDAPPRAAHTIYLERHGATLTPGDDDSVAARSSIIRASKQPTVTFPAFRGGDRAWKAFVACMKAEYARFDVTVTDTKPDRRSYVLVVVGGSPALIGFPKTTGGLAPYSGDVVEDPVVLVFSETLQNRVNEMCETGAMEVAHAYGLDHEYLCKDPMSYLSGCGHKTFQDATVPCGEKKRRDCGDGAPLQNSVQRLLAVLGPAR